MNKPIFPFSVHLPGRGARRDSRLMRKVTVWVIGLMIFNTFLAFILLALTQHKSLQPTFVGFSQKTKRFVAIEPTALSDKKTRLETAQEIAREKFVQDYVLFRETVSARSAHNHRRFCDCYDSNREQKLIQKTRNRTVEPRCSVCLMSTQPIFTQFQSEILPHRLEQQTYGQNNSIKIQKITFLETIENERLYEVAFVDSAKKYAHKLAIVGVRDVPPEKMKEYFFQVTSYGLMVNTHE